MARAGRARGFTRAAGVAAIALSGCTVGPDFHEPAPWWSPVSWFQGRPPRIEARAGMPGSETVAEPIDPKWWSLFGDPQLSALEERVAASNLDIRVSTVRLAESRASLNVARADQIFNVNANTSYTREKQSKKGVLALFGGSGGSGGVSSQAGSGSGQGGLPNTPATGTAGAASNGLGGTTSGIPAGGSLGAPFDLFQYGFDASWELDFWGRIRRNVESAAAQTQQSEEQRRNTLLTSLSEMARDYIQLRGVQRQLQITRQNVDSNQRTLSITQQRASGGLTTDLDVAQAAAQLASTQSQIPNLEAQQAQLVNAISLLLGEAPNALSAELLPAKPIPPVPPHVPVGVPSELARRRPDIRAAEAQLHAATADVGVAVADFYPKVTLSGSFALQGLQLRNLADWEARTYSLGPSISLPIFEGGRLRGTLALRKGQQEEAAINYQKTVLQALHDVDNALTGYDSEQRRRAQLEASVAQNRRALGIAQDRYTQGIADFLSVLDSQRSLLSAEQQLADSTTTISTNLVQLYKSLGGGWETEYPLAPPVGDQQQAAQ